MASEANRRCLGSTSTRISPKPARSKAADSIAGSPSANAALRDEWRVSRIAPGDCTGCQYSQHSARSSANTTTSLALANALICPRWLAYRDRCLRGGDQAPLQGTGGGSASCGFPRWHEKSKLYAEDRRVVLPHEYVQALHVAAISSARSALATDGEFQAKPITGPNGLEQLDV